MAKIREIKLNKSHIRSVTADDLPFLKDVVETSGLFPSEMLPEMIGESLYGNFEDHHWITLVTDNPLAIAYFAPERMTSGTWNLYLIAVHSNDQNSGIGTRLMEHIERYLRQKEARVLIVETSDLPEYSRTRRFYEKLGYKQEAHIREFYDEGEGKIVFWKKLT